MWNNKQDSIYVSALSPMLARKRKRARSSSPISSPSADKTEPPTVDVGMLREALKSADPTLELWDRYSLNGLESVVSPAGAVNPVLEQLMISSSPKPSKNTSIPRTEGNLRRAMSCGLVWPKRRKMSKTGSQGEQRELEAASKSSLVTALLDTATYNLLEESPQHATSSSPKKSRLRPTDSSSPCQAASDGGAATLASSDYGDDDFDDDTFMELEATIQIVDPATPGATGQLPRAGVDEFQDLDDSIFDQANGLANGSDPLEPKPAVLCAAPASQEWASSAQGDPSDEFEDDFDGDIDFDAVELAATQSVQQCPRSPKTNTPQVCENNARPSNYSIC